MRKISLLLPLALLGACNSGESGTVTGADGETVDYAVEGDGEQAEVRITGADGEAVVINTNSDSAVLPLGFTLYPGASLVSNSQIATNDGKGSVLYQTTADSPAEVAAFYRRQAEAAGIAIAMQTTTGTSQTLAGEEANGNTFMMTASTTEEGTGVQLMIGEKP